ncbi:alpha-tocopherol transfer protein-like [Macrosteles quadrilineatus]|uniref:alpha-tocopherol transfer protein-like n=1 Tax=Macrosteles quadrilineatus TaxID=74068 RepID=UPI0023E0EECC|nr:alpha-tocopherol transfer protein-like [Macrosteles quadrilineatus]
MALAPITVKQRKTVEDELGYDDVQVQKKIEQIKDWMKKQPHLPSLPDDYAVKFIRQYLIGTKFSTEVTKYKIDTFFSMRHQLPEIFCTRDPLQKDVIDSIDKVRYLCLPDLTPEGYRVHILNYNDEDKEKRFTGKDLKGFYKRMMATASARVMQDEFCCGEVLISDSRGFYLNHLTELPWLFIQKFTSLAQEGLPIRIKGVYMINNVSYVEQALNILKPCFKEKVRKRIHVLSGDHTSLYKYIPQKMLPKDYGGDGPSIVEQTAAWQKTIESMRDFIIEDDKRRTDEAKRPKDNTNVHGQLFGINGTFNKLNID